MTSRKNKIKALLSLTACCGLYFIWGSQLHLQVIQEDSIFLGEIRSLLSRIEPTEEKVPQTANHINISLTPNNASSSDDGWAAWEAEQNRRKEVIKNVCKNLRIPNKDTLRYIQAENYYRQFLVDDTHKALYCFIPKVACTNWKKVWMMLTGLTKERNFSAIPLMVPHENTSEMEFMQTTRTYRAAQAKLRSYKKFMVVRHPFQRLLSAYRDKIHHELGVPYFQRQLLPYVKKTRASANMTNMQWQEFVDFLIVKGSKNVDNHWRSYEALCHPCAIEFDVVAKLETLQEDSERFLKIIGAPEDIRFPNTSRTSRRVDREFWMEYQKMLSQEQITKLYEAYKRDFKLFEYD